MKQKLSNRANAQVKALRKDVDEIDLRMKMRIAAYDNGLMKEQRSREIF